MRIPETNSFCWFMNILSIKVAVWLVILEALPRALALPKTIDASAGAIYALILSHYLFL